jgi:Xaa-Pro dipeptidase
MITRRDFLGVSSVALAGTACQAGASVDAPAVQPVDPAPAPISALSSMREQATPIPLEERLTRLERARELMRESSHAALFLTGGTSLNYFTNVRWGLSERLFAVVIPLRGDAFVVCPAFEEDRAREQLSQGPLAASTAVLTWQENEDPYALVARGLRERGLTTGRIGVEETVRFVFSNGVANVAPALEVVSGTPVTAGCRTIKSENELGLMRLASQVTLRAYEAAYRSLQEGMTQADFAGLVSTAHSRLGFPGGASVQTGEFSALPHGSVMAQTIREGTILLIDGGCTVEGYQSDISRTFVLGAPTDRMKEVFDVELRAQTAALHAARPGVPCEDVDAAARKVIVDAGFGPGYTYFTHRVGHGIGMDGHEWPYLVQGNTLPLAAGMTFSDEPGIYIRGEFGVRLEDDMVITEGGAELMTPQSPSLESPFGPMI